MEPLRQIGIERVPASPWGTHFCVFYRTPQDLLDILVPYFKTGLEHNEFCMWVTSEPLRADKAWQALGAVVPNLSEYEARGQIAILDYSQWYTLGGHFDADRVLAGWVEKERDVVQRGFDGLRLTGNTFWLEEADWRAFIDYEAKVDSVITQYRMIAVCTYSLDKCGASEVIDVTNEHQFALAQRGGRWEMIESADWRRAEEARRYAAELEQRVAERTRELELHRQLLETVVNHKPAAVNLIRGGDLRLQLINPAYQAIAPGKEMVGKTLDELWPETGQSFGQICQRVLATGEPYQVEDELNMIQRRPAGPLEAAYFSWSLHRVRLPGDDGWGILNTAWETTERKLAQDRIEKLNQELELQTEELQAANINLEQQAEELQVANVSLEEALTLEHAARAAAQASQHIVEQREQEIQRLNQHLEQRAGELETANQELEAFAYSVSHDLRTPLASVENFARLLLEECLDTLPPQGQVYLHLVRENTQAMNRLIEGLLSFSRSTRQPLKKQWIHPADLVRQVLAELYPPQTERGVEITVGELPACEADPMLLKQVWTNLLSNALKFTRHREPPRIEIGYGAEDAPGAYFVRDNGAGFDMAQADKLFGVFQRFHSEDEFEGTGVGLAIVDRIIRRHGGRIWADAKVNEGATFYFTLPPARVP